MGTLDFRLSKKFTLGVELEFQIINPHSRNLTSSAKQLLRFISKTEFAELIKPEITQSMIEINSSVHQNVDTLLTELITMRDFLAETGKKFHVLFSGAGTHPFQKWVSRKIFPTERFRKISRRFRYLAKRATVFGQHVHIGCSSADDALYLTHALGYFTPQLIAMSAASPFDQRVDTGFYSIRAVLFYNTSPFSGTIPYLTDWQAFSDYFYKLKNIGVVSTMKDFYWDVRPKPEFGTVEIRVCDTPLTVRHAVLLTAYLQTLAAYLLNKRPIEISSDLYTLYQYNRFQASRYALDGEIIHPNTKQKLKIYDGILETLTLIAPFSDALGTKPYLDELKNKILNRMSDAAILREIYDQTGDFKQVVDEQCRLWKV